jgi:hypothetical protein
LIHFEDELQVSSFISNNLGISGNAEVLIDGRQVATKEERSLVGEAAALGLNYYRVSY